MTHGSCGNWGTSEKTGRTRSRVRAPYVPIQGDEPHRRALRAALRARGAARAGGAPAALGDARRAALVPGPARLLERFGGARQPHLGRMGRRAAAARRTLAHVRVLPERARAAAAAARRSARGALRYLWGSPGPPERRRRCCRRAARVREAPARRARVRADPRPRRGEPADRSRPALRLRARARPHLSLIHISEPT